MPINFVADALAAGGVPIEAAQANAQRKQYDMVISMKITETGTSKSFYDASSNWTAVPYGVVVVTQKALVELLGKFTDLGAAIASGSTTPPAAKP